jgi:hypothetical protein
VLNTGLTLIGEKMLSRITGGIEFAQSIQEEIE